MIELFKYQYIVTHKVKQIHSNIYTIAHTYTHIPLRLLSVCLFVEIQVCFNVVCVCMCVCVCLYFISLYIMFNTLGSKEFYKGIADITGGRYLSLRNASLLPDIIIGGGS